MKGSETVDKTRHDEHDSAAKSSALERAKVSVVADAQRSTVCRHARCEAVAEDMYTSVEAETGARRADTGNSDTPALRHDAQ